jgi:RND family efflux transporter MFP subunit
MQSNVIVGLGCAAIAAALLSGCGRSDQGAQPAAPLVTVGHPAVVPVTDYLELTGTAAASQTVDLVARVPGYLQSIKFEDGSFVKSGQLLFVIEPQPYEENVRIAQAQMLRAQSELDRQQEMVKENATSVANVERWQSQRDQASAQLALAKLNLSYTQVTAPFSGRIGRHLVDTGNMVGVSGETKLASVEVITPVYVYFNLNERDALRIREAMEKSGIKPSYDVERVPVWMGLQNEDGYPHEGRLDFVDNGVSTATGTIQLRAVYPNEDRTIFPGLFTRVRIPLGKPQPLPVVPCDAIATDQQGDYVLVVGSDDVVARRAVEKGPAASGGCSLRGGVASADRVVVNGLQNARPGRKVRTQESAAAASG